MKSGLNYNINKNLLIEKIIIKNKSINKNINKFYITELLSR